MKHIRSFTRLACVVLLLAISSNAFAQGMVLPYGLLKKVRLSDGMPGYTSYLKVPFTNKADLEATAMEVFRKTVETANNPGYVTILLFPNYNTAMAMDTFPDLENRWLARIDTTEHMPVYVSFNNHRLAYLTDDTTGDAAARKEAAAMRRANPEYLSTELASVKLEVAKINNALAQYDRDICMAAWELKRVETEVMKKSGPGAIAEMDFRVKGFQKQYDITDEMLYKIRMLSVYACD